MDIFSSNARKLQAIKLHMVMFVKPCINTCFSRKIPEHQHLKQIYVDEQFPEMSQQKQNESQKQILAQNKAKIGYDYDENDRSWNSNRGTSQYSNRGKAADGGVITIPFHYFINPFMLSQHYSNNTIHVRC